VTAVDGSNGSAVAGFTAGAAGSGAAGVRARRTAARNAASESNGGKLISPCARWASRCCAAVRRCAG
jgi:hypothetical protein